jgi:uncharacterized protein YdaU (DUF1376 family)
MNYFPFHIGDYAIHTRHLSDMEDLAYRRMLDLYYTTEKPLPGAEQTARLIGMRDYVAEVATVLADFFKEQDGVYVQARVEREIAKFKLMAEGGKRGAAKRWAKGSDSPPIAHLSPPVSPPNANQEPRTKNQEPKEIHGSASTELPASDKPTPPLKAKDLVAEGVDPQAAADWLALRKAKRLPLTATAWDDTKAEGQKLGLTPAQAVAHAVTHNWAGFRASWLDQNRPGQATPAKNIFAGAL